MISLIVAMDYNGLIGKGNGLPWHIPADMKHFKKITTGKTVVMGEKTYESIGKALPNRENVVACLSGLSYDGATTITDLKTYLQSISEEKEVIVIGGATIYKLAEPFVDRLYITQIAAKYVGDVYFPKYDMTKFKMVHKVVQDNLSFLTYEKIKK